jgi:photosystem II stability/assembly factor-like uncharacterized protein
MSKKLIVCTLAMSIFVVSSSARAQQWLNDLPQTSTAELSIADITALFEKYYRDHQVDVRKESFEPNPKFESEEAEKFKISTEEVKLFRRWQWLVEPRAYPSGKLDQARLEALRDTVPQADVKLQQQAEAGWQDKVLEARRARPHWEPIGPRDAVGGTNMGRVNCLEFDPKNPRIIFICSADGGVWKSVNGGATWATTFDLEPTLSTGDVAISRQHPNVIYVATSDAFGYNVPFWGGTYSVGVVKSLDGGLTWKKTNLTWTVAQNRTIRRLVIHPTNDKILLAATSAGVYRTDNGGASWKLVVPTSAYTAEFDPSNGKIAYVTTNQVFKSTTAGATFSALTATCAGSRYNLKISHSNPGVLYTLCTNGTVQKSVDAGLTWSNTTPPGVSLYGYYDDVLAVSPMDPKILVVAGFNIMKSTDGGTSWNAVPAAGHVDNHTIRFAPGSSTTLFSGNDGGIFKSIDGGSNWTSLNKGLAITQFYSLGVGATSSTIIVAGAQDNGNMKYAAGSFSSITNADGMRDFVDWSNNSVIYASIQYGSLYRSTNGGSTFTSISTPASGAWETPWSQDATTATTIYAATDKVYKSVDQGTTWTPLGTLSGLSFTVLRVASSNPKVIYAGSGSKLFRTANGGGTWTDISAGLPLATNLLTDVAIDSTNPDAVFATFSGYVAGEKVYRTSNGGASWTNFSGSLPNMPVDTIVYESGSNHAIYIGTDAGVYYRDGHLSNWIPYKTGLPNVIVDGLHIDYGHKELFAATYGRGIWKAPLH